MKPENRKPKTENRKFPAAFIDRDGTLIEEVNYLSRVEDLRLFPFTAEAIQLLKDNGFLVIVITNQSGIDRGMFEESVMHDIHAKIQSELNETIDAFYFCPHLPADGCLCRKPNPGMIKDACTDFAIDQENSWIIGDKAIDAETGFGAKIKTALVLTGYGQNELEKLSGKPDLIAADLLEAVRKIVEK